MNEALQRDLTAQSEALAALATTSRSLTEDTLAAITRENPRLNAFLHLDADGALAAADASDARRAIGAARGPLDGLTLAVKDNIDVAGMPTTAGMATRRGRVAERDAFVVRQLRDAGMVVLGKLHMHEAALGATSDNPHFGRCVNPHREGFTPGGSSGGAAVAVAAGLCALALGTDTLGSVRLPASYCGVVGLKASYGLVSTGGTVACGYLLDHVGPLVRSHRDLALVMPLLASYDPACADARDITLHAPPATVRFVAAAVSENLGLSPEVEAAYRAALDALRDAGHAVHELSLAAYEFGRARRAGLLLVEADLLVEHAADWREQRANFSPELTRLMHWAERQPASAYAAAARTVAAAHTEVARWWQHGEVMVLPTTPQTAFAFGGPVPANQADLTCIANMAGVPAMSLPLPRQPAADGGLPGLPVGLQFIAPRGHEATLLSLDLSAAIAA